MRRVRSSSGQVAMEYLIVFLMAFFMTMPLIIIFYTQSNNFEDDISVAQANKLTSELIDAAEEVYFLGSPSQKTVDVTFPNGLQEITIESNSLILNMTSKGDDYLVYGDTLVNLTGILRTSPGRRPVKVVATGTGVQITD
ncbi:hypothetical protein JXA48_02190 [Candidatus Woesearchaeota archaeon]|nr:hypothetical protein [Candidatus Woesearchaeota archaeon]